MTGEHIVDVLVVPCLVQTRCAVEESDRQDRLCEQTAKNELAVRDPGDRVDVPAQCRAEYNHEQDGREHRTEDRVAPDVEKPQDFPLGQPHERGALGRKRLVVRPDGQRLDAGHEAASAAITRSYTSEMSRASYRSRRKAAYPRSTIRPARMSALWSQSVSASCSYCVVSRIVVPAALSPVCSLQISERN